MDIYNHYYYNVARSPSRWGHPEAAECGCRGTGWFVSEVDTVHKCGLHWEGEPCPHDEIFLPYLDGESRLAYRAARAELLEVGEVPGYDNNPRGWRHFDALFTENVERYQREEEMSEEYAKRYALRDALLRAAPKGEYGFPDVEAYIDKVVERVRAECGPDALLEEEMSATPPPPAKDGW
jgi:hypothetical protein